MTENEEGHKGSTGKPVKAPPGLSDPFAEEVKIRDPRPEPPRCQTGVSADAGEPLAPEVQENEGKERLSAQTRLSILSWNAGLKEQSSE